MIAYRVELWGWEEKELEKVMLDYVRWIYRLDFCTPRYVITRELGVEKLKVKWGLRALRYEDKIKGKGEDNWVKKYWKEKESMERKREYSREKAKFFSRNR